MQAEREARLESEQSLAHLSRRMVALEAALLQQSGSTPSLENRLENLESAMSSQLSIGSTPASPSTTMDSERYAPHLPKGGVPSLSPSSPLVPPTHPPPVLPPHVAASRGAGVLGAGGPLSITAATGPSEYTSIRAQAVYDDLPPPQAESVSSINAVLGLEETLGSILSHLDARAVGRTAAVGCGWSAAAHGTLGARRMLFIFGSIDVFAQALLHPKESTGSSMSGGGTSRSPVGSPTRGGGGGGGGGGGKLFTTSDGFLCCSQPLLLVDEALADEELAIPPPGTSGGGGCGLSGRGGASRGTSVADAAFANTFGSSSICMSRPLSAASTTSTTVSEYASIRAGASGSTLSNAMTTARGAASASRPTSAAFDFREDRESRASAAAEAREVRACLSELKAVYGGTDYCLLLTKSGKVLSFGTAVHGRLGYEITAKMPIDPNGDPFQSHPALVSGGGLGEAKVKSAIVSELHTAVLSEDGRLFTWGSNSFGNLGYAECEPLSESATRSTSAGGSLCQRVPRQVIGGGLGTRRVVAICSSDYSTLCATDMGDLFSWGSAVYGQLGYPVTDDMETDTNGSPYQLIPRHVDGGSLRGSRRKRASPVIAVTCSNLHSVVLTADGAVHCFGCACAGKLGLESTSGLSTAWDGLIYQPTPQRVRGELMHETVAQIACSDYHNAVITEGGELWMWGCAVYGKLGFTPTSACAGFAEGTPYEPNPSRVGGGLRGRRVVQALCSSVHSAAVTADGGLWTWGSTLYASLGYPPTAAMPVDANNFPYQPKPVNVALPGVRVLRLVSAVYEPPTDDSLCPCSTKSCTVAITTGGVFTFGLADDGGLGYPPLPEMHTTVIGGYSRKAQWRPRLVHASWSLLGTHAEGRDEPKQWSEKELTSLLHQVAVTPTSTHIIAAPVAPRGR